MKAKILVKLCLGVLYLQSLQAQNLSEALNSLENDSLLKQGFLAFCLMDAQTGKVLAEKNMHKKMNVASCHKLWTTATALEVLGKDFRFQTQLAHSGKIENGTLKGNLYIIGGGDITLGSTDFKGVLSREQIWERWYKILQNLKVQKIEGQVVGVGAYFEQNAIPEGWIKEDLGNYYGSAAYGLNISDNEYKLLLKPASKVGEKAQILGTDPTLPFLKFKGEILTAPKGTGDNAYIDGYPFHYENFVRGTVPQESSFFIKGAMPNPPYVTAFLLKDYLQKRGLSVSQEASFSFEAINEKLIILDSISSPTLAEIIREINLYSVNLYAEGLFRQLGKYWGKESEAGAKILEFWLKKGIESKGLNFNDGSGLSRLNTSTAFAICQMLVKMAQNETFVKSLPVAGISGTLTGFGKNTILQGNLQAKTGSMRGVIAFAGYFTNSKGEKRCFAIIANQYEGKYATMRSKFEKILLKAAE
ncbi:D-alanyl-D-alanine carboxypeptidase/D-alanyl-D-alanine endopeptidase [Raineya orbicola]|jgi:D-alanyl-D-alanine carboxypeptidase/D-alanyl-D-alanine-endopeptidase (penicillin-binding protein 4)|uniref:PBP4: D-alanyl-D-alanine carboxypeptidase/D-alanyl-D-alanine-endopeptidase n=1 Tax=Raineya orbicola TaxID=2016530 RepID=A0A2N3IJF8_9BACT|nr:D-alanyl-D-alanine carboxypeptidase/D-alanyl-D-alanine-endopeptidase [Raineya orbicola]PKQ70401.1 PBP4: D-alanyl-D-alanine carboxypeptidase/D-alanyl-D-alanine-endopeptidase [Raineya orbicola]